VKVFFDTNVYVAEALLGKAAERMIQATIRARWRIYVNQYVLNELADVLTEDFGCSRRLAILSQRRILRRSMLVEGTTSAKVPDDPKDNAVLAGAIGGGVDLLVTNDRHLLILNPYRGLRILSMTDYHTLVTTER